jgi:acetoin utilization protein AcuB
VSAVNADAHGRSRRDSYTEGNRREQRQRAIVAKQLMSSPVVCLEAGDSIETATRLIRKRRFRHVPVLSRDGLLVGIISDRDLLRLGPDSQRGLSEVMGTPVVSAAPGTSIREVARLLFEERIGGMPIVDDQDALVGILTRSDILHAIVNEAPLDVWI